MIDILFICGIVGGLFYFFVLLAKAIELIKTAPEFLASIWMKIPFIRNISTKYSYEIGLSYNDIYAHPKHVLKYFKYRIKYYYWRKFKETKFYKLILKWTTQLKNLNQKKTL